MNFLEILNKINTLCLWAYPVYFVLGYNDFFLSKEQNGAMFVALVMFLTTFICGGITLAFAGKADVDTGISADKILKELKSPMLIRAIICIIEIVILMIFYHGNALMWCVGVIFISFAFVTVERIILPQITQSKVYKISFPLYLFPLPFVIFIGGNLYLSTVLQEDVFDKAAIFLFVLCGMIMAAMAWHGYYKVDTESGTIEKNYGIISEFRKSKKIISFDDIKYIEISGIYYVIQTKDDQTMKISRLYNGIKRFKKTITDNEIIVTNNRL